MLEPVNPLREKTVWFIVPGLGEPRLHDKLAWLQDNVARMVARRGPWNVRLRVYCYAQETLPAAVWPNEPACPVEIVYERGVVFQYLYRHITPDRVDAQAAYVFFLLDDVRLGHDFSLQEAVAVYGRVQCDLLAAALTPTSPTPWLMMRQDHEALRRGCQGRRTNFVEFFATLMSATTYRRYYDTCLTEDTAWGWGIDMMLDSLGFRLFLWDASPVAHGIALASYARRPDKDPKAESNLTIAHLASRGGLLAQRGVIHEYLS